MTGRAARSPRSRHPRFQRRSFSTCPVPAPVQYPSRTRAGGNGEPNRAKRTALTWEIRSGLESLAQPETFSAPDRRVLVAEKVGLPGPSHNPHLRRSFFSVWLSPCSLHFSSISPQSFELSVTSELGITSIQISGAVAGGLPTPSSFRVLLLLAHATPAWRTPPPVVAL